MNRSPYAMKTKKNRHVTGESNTMGSRHETAAQRGQAYVIHPFFAATEGNRTPEASLKEAVGLAEAIGIEVTQAALAKIGKVQPSTLLGSGTVERIAGEIAEAARQERAIDLVIVDHALSPVQQRNLEKAFQAKVIDRTGLILEIFGDRARTREGQLQVELAALSYQRSRLVRSWTHLERQRGGFGFIGGPGESQLEIDRRLIGQRIVKLKKELEEVRRTRGLHRKARARVPYPVVALVGYTNAGKSTLFNRLSGADAVAKDMLFATLDPSMRSIMLPAGGKVILSDTVGFISDLPTHLVEAFRATLEEVQSADIILHVRDVAHPDTEAQKADVDRVLAELGIDPESDPRLIEVLNKIDLPDAGEQERIRAQASRSRTAVAASAVTGEGVDRLLVLLGERRAIGRQVVELDVELADGATLSWLYAKGDVLERRDEGMHAHLQVAMDPAHLSRLPVGSARAALV
jgi:GTPase